MLNEDEVKKLAELSRLEISKEEIKQVSSELSKILEYVGQISEAEAGDTRTKEALHNVWRNDENPHESGEFSDDLLAEAPKRKGDYVKVKKVMWHKIFM